MRERIKTGLNKYIKRGKALEYFTDAVELYESGGDSLKRVYAEVAIKRGVKAGAVERSCSLAVAEADSDVQMTAKELIALIKERILFEIDE